MATLEKLTRLSEPSIQGAQSVKKIAKDANELVRQSQEEHQSICKIHPKLAFLIADSHVQIKLCQSLEGNLKRHLADLESTVQAKEQQANDLFQEMATILELLKSREVNEIGSHSIKDGKHTLYDHIDQEAVDSLESRVKQYLQQLQDISKTNSEQCTQTLHKINHITIPEAEDISITWEGVQAMGNLIADSQSAIDDISQDLQSVERHCDQLRDTIRDLEVQGGTLSIDDYNVLLHDTDEIPGIVADLEEALSGVRQRADEINVRHLQYSAFFDESKRRFAAVSEISDIFSEYVQTAAGEQSRYVALVAALDTALEDMWGLVTWYRQFHSAYDGLIAEVHRRRQAQRDILAAVDDMRARLDALHMEELQTRAAFVDKDGPYLPSDLCPFIQDPPSRFVIEEVADAGRFASVQSHETRTHQVLSEAAKRGLVLGVLSNNKLLNADSASLSNAQQQSLVAKAAALGFSGEAGKVQTVLSDDLQQHIALVGLGDTQAEAAKISTTETEIVRTAVATGVRQLLQARKVDSVTIAPMPHAQAAAEGAQLALYKFDQFKSSKEGEDEAPASINVSWLDSTQKEWDAGQITANAQNFARDLMNTPANFMTPTLFAERVAREFQGLDNVHVRVHGPEWVKEQKMGGLLTVSQGSNEPLRFLEIEYRGSGADTPVDLGLVGKGVTFDTGGYSLKPGRYMDAMKGDMGGGAVVVAAMRALAQLRVPINIVAAVPLCENMINGKAVKVSDVYTSRAGITVEVMNTDAEGRLILADALHYVTDVHKPTALVDVATLTGAMVVALGEHYTGVFTPSPHLWQRIERAAHTADEPAWRMPLHDCWDAMLKSPVADLSNIGNRAEAGACTAAAFLRQFVHGKRAGKGILGDQNNDEESSPKWAHLDIAGPMEAASTSGYHTKGMSGRPTRLLIALAQDLAHKKLN
ncbi:hypothetical protein LPJ55_003966 [Coemansia sp. RSA 990]|nr:hypothetical protein LPJ55_003966 [Coemansia sp. RSA 990]